MLGRILAYAVMDLGKAANGGKVFRRQLEDVFELFSRVLQPADFDQRAAERDVSGQVGRMAHEAGCAGCNRLLETLGAPVLLGERREGDGRRVRLDPAFQFFNARSVRHGLTDYSTVTVLVTRPVLPALSVTVSVTL